MPATSEWCKVVSEDNLTLPYQIFTKPLEKSQVDKRDYRVVRLENGLTALLVHDSGTEDAAASLDVAVGHLSDPDDMPGLAHFCEHLLFMGTKQFPKENEYSEYLSKHNGGSNAHTSTTNTNYHFRVSPDALRGALEIFSAFFHSPLFSPSCTIREINAVDSENKKNHLADDWRIFQLNKSLSIPGHPWRKFGTGNRDTLLAAAREAKKLGNLASNHLVNGNEAMSSDASTAPSPISSRIPSPAPSSPSVNSESDADGGSVGHETRRRVMEWWSKEYCASRMKLCVIGREPLKQLADMVSRLFSPVLNRDQDPLPLFRDHPFGPNEKGTLVSVDTIQSLYVLEISFPLDWQPPLWRSKPGRVVSHFLGHEAPGSLFAYLKGKGWINSLNAATQDLAHGFAMIKTTMELTKEGFDDYRSVVLATFNYLSILRSSKPCPWHLTEIATILKTRFHFAEKRAAEGYALGLAKQMHWPVPTEKLLSAPALAHGWEDAEGQQDVWNNVLAVLENMRVDTGRVVLMAKKEEHERIAEGQSDWAQEDWYGTEYKVERWDDKFLAKASSPEDNPSLYLPGPNKFMPTNFDVEKCEVLEPQRRPHLIAQSTAFKLWYKKDDQFWVPKARVIIDIRSPIANSSPRAVVLTELYVLLVIDSLAEPTYDAELAGLRYNIINSTPLGLTVVVQGYNDKLTRFVECIVCAMKNLVVREDRLKAMKEKLGREWSNFFLKQSYQLSDYYALYMLSHQAWTPEEFLTELPGISLEEVVVHSRKLFERVNMQILVLGNIHQHEAITLSEGVERILEPGPLSETPSDLALILPHGCNYMWTTSVPNSKECNSALTYYLHLGQFDDPRQRVLGTLLIQIMKEPVFNVLRTKEQLGYIAGCTRWVLPGESQFGLRFLVQSERGTGYLEERVEAFLDTMDGKLQEMKTEDFNDFKKGLQQKWREPDENSVKEAGRFYQHIANGFLDFLRRFEDADLLEKIGKHEVLALFRERVHPKAANRSKLSVHMQSQAPQVSTEALNAFEVLVQEAGLANDLANIKEKLGKQNPVVEDFVKRWEEILTEDPQDLVKKLHALVKQYPHRDKHLHSGSADITPVEDVKNFKAGLQVSLPPRPLVEWNDLPEVKE